VCQTTWSDNHLGNMEVNSEADLQIRWRVTMWTDIYGWALDPGVDTIHSRFIINSSSQNVTVQLCVKSSIYRSSTYAGHNNNFGIYGRSHVNLSNKMVKDFA
jgi:hypothetical protein